MAVAEQRETLPTTPTLKSLTFILAGPTQPFKFNKLYFLLMGNILTVFFLLKKTHI